MKRVTLVLSLCVAIASPALAQYPKSSSTPRRTEAQKALMAKGHNPDSAFVIAAAQSAYAGAVFAKLAQEKAASADVKRFAKRVAQESGRMSEELKPILKAQKSPEPTDLDQRNKAVHEWLVKLSASDFDRAYMSNMASMQANELMLFERASTKAHDGDVKAWASKNLPALKDQQQSAASISKKLTTN